MVSCVFILINLNTKRYHEKNIGDNNNSTFYLHADNEIYLSDGFYAAEGSDFFAEVISHDISGNRNGNTKPDKEDVDYNYEKDEPIVEDEMIFALSDPNPSAIDIYPNPANDNITIEFTADYNSIEIYDSFGRKTMCRQVNTTTSQQVIDVDISNYPSGLYLVVVNSDNERYYKRIVKN